MLRPLVPLIGIVALQGSLPWIGAAEPKPLAISNASFEESSQAARAKPSIPGWIEGSTNSLETKVVDQDAALVNPPKFGKRWLLLNSGDSVGQKLGTGQALFSGVPQSDRLFVSLVVSSLQSREESNEVDLMIQLYGASSLESWEGGMLLASKRVQDLTNDERGDLNSYLDAFAVLKLDKELIRETSAKHLWLVLNNLAPAAASQAALTIDGISVNVASPPQSHRNPNFLIIFQDDMGYGDTTVLNPNSKIPTPHLDRLASQGMRFLDAHTAATICGPSRIGLLTGTMPSKLGVRGNSVPGATDRLGPSTFPAGTPTLATMCQQAGYDTAVVGKWGIPSNWQDRVRSGATEKITLQNAATIVDFAKPLKNADEFGFMYRYIFDENRPFLRGETEPFEGNDQPFGWHENGFAVRDVLTHSQDKLHEFYLRAITDRAIRYLQTQAGLRSTNEGDFRVREARAPFYLHYLTHAPHLPVVPAAQFIGMSHAGKYGDFVIDLDYSLGRVMHALDEIGLGENTLVIFSADNGPEHFAYERAEKEGHFSMGPLRGVKRDLYEGGHRVPLVVRWPAVVKAGTVCPAVVNLTDWYATFAAILNAHPRDDSGLDSMNILPLLKGEAKEVRGLMLQDSCVNGIARAIRIGSWKYIDQESGELNRKRETAWFRELRKVEDAPGNELFHLTEDLAESKNLIAQESARAIEMKAIFDKLWKDNVRSTPPFAQQKDTDADGYSDFYEEFLGAN